jgi:hypothetical protein
MHTKMKRIYVDTTVVLGNFDKGETRRQPGVIKSVIIPDNPESERLSAVVSAWASLPPNIQKVILLLVRQHVQ